MFDFKKKRLDPLLHRFVERINGAMPVNTPEQAVQLLAVKKDVTTQFGKLAQGQGAKSKITLGTTLLLAAGAVAAVVLAPPAAIGAAIGGAVALLGGGFVAQKYALNKSEATRSRYVLSDKIDTEVAIAVTRMSGAVISPDVRAALAQAFAEVSNRKDYETLAKRAMKFTPKTAVPAR